MFPKEFLAHVSKLSIASASEMLKWTNAWLSVRSDQKDYERGENDLPMENMFIHLAFNQLSNQQLKLWKKSLAEYVKPKKANNIKANLTVTQEDIQLGELYDWFDLQLRSFKADASIIPSFFDTLQSIQSPPEV